MSQQSKDCRGEGWGPEAIGETDATLQVSDNKGLDEGKSREQG